MSLFRSGAINLTDKPNFIQRNLRTEGLLNGIVYTDDLYDNSTQLHRELSRQRSNSGLKRPQKLEALNLNVQRNKSFA